MGSILTNGVFLPAEGERNCYEGLAANWVALDGLIGGYSAHAADLTIHVTAADKEAWNGKADASALTAHTGNTTIHVTAADKEAWNGKADASALTAHTGNTTIHVTAEDKAKWDAVTGKADASALTAHTGDTTIHVTAADKEAWNGKADASALTAHTGDTTIHVTAEDKTKWDAVTSKANDTDVLHKTGDEASTGKKTFGDMATFKGSYLGTEVSTNARTVMVLESNRDTSGQSGLYITKFRQNKAQGAMTGNDVVYIAFDVLENSVRTDRALRASFTQFVNDKPTKVIFYSDVSGDRCLGADTTKWTEINGLNPGALSMPNLSAGVDISSYVTNLLGGTNNFTPTVDGYISLCVISTGSNGVFIRQGDFGSSGRDLTISGTRYAYACLPVVKNIQVDIAVISQSLGFAKFYPCQGNI